MYAWNMQRQVFLVLAISVAGLLGRADGARASRNEWQQPDRVVVDLGLEEGDAVADIGCGRGFFTFRLAKAVGETGTVYATEISSRALQSVSNRIERDALTNVNPVLSDPTDTKLESNNVDAAFLCNVLHHVPRDQRLPLTKDIVRAIKPGGFLFLVDWREKAEISHDRDRRIPKDDLLKMIKDAGLKLDAEFYYLEHQVFLRCRKPTEDEAAAAAAAQDAENDE